MTRPSVERRGVGALHQYALQNLAAVVVVLLLARRGDPLSAAQVARRVRSLARRVGRWVQDRVATSKEAS